MEGLVELNYSFYYMAQADACANKGDKNKKFMPKPNPNKDGNY